MVQCKFSRPSRRKGTVGREQSLDSALDHSLHSGQDPRGPAVQLEEEEGQPPEDSAFQDNSLLPSQSLRHRAGRG